RLFGRGLVGFAAGAAALGALEGFRWNPDTGPLVSALAVVGILGYVTALGDVFHVQNKNLVHTRDSLRSSEAQFRFIAEHAGDLVAVIGADGILQYASPSYAEHYDPERSAPGRDWLELVHPDDRGKAGRFLAYLRASMKQDRAELRMAMAGRAALRVPGQPGRRDGRRAAHDRARLPRGGRPGARRRAGGVSACRQTSCSGRSRSRRSSPRPALRRRSPRSLRVR